MEPPQGRNIVVTIRTVFEYGPEAVDRLISTYKQKDYSNHVECKFNPMTQSFILEGDSVHSELAFYEFMDLVHKAIHAETTKRRLPGEYAPIRRSKLTQLNSTAIVWSELDDDDPKDPKLKNRAIMSSRDPRYAQSMPHPSMQSDLTASYQFIEFWEPTITAGDFSLMLHLHDGRSLTNEIAKVCNCALYPNWEKRNVKIGANSRRTIDRVVRKLRKIQELFKRGFEPVTVVFVYPEEKATFEFKLVALEKQPELCRTTMFSNSSKWNGYAKEKMFRIRMMEYNANKDRFVPCQLGASPTWAAYIDNGMELRDWVGYMFNGWGSADMNPLLAAERPGSENGSGSEGTPDLTSLEPEDLVGQYNKPGGAQSIVTGQTGEHSCGRQAQPGANGAFDLGSRPSTDDGVSAPGRSIVGTIRHPRPRAKELARFDYKENSIDQRTEPRTEASSHLKDLASLQFEDPLVDTTNQPQSAGLSQASSIMTGGIELGPSPTEKHLGTGIELPSRPPSQVVNRFAGFSNRIVEPSDTKPTTTTRTVRKPREKRPRSGVGPDESSKPPEKKEEVSEIDTRNLRNIMGQRMPPRKKQPDGSSESEKLKKHNARRLYEVFTESFNYARTWRGHVRFEVDLGRIVMINVPKPLAKVTIDWKEWESTLAKSEDMRPLFTERISTEWFDAEKVIDLKLSKAEMIFNPEPIHSKTKVTYEFHCTHKGKLRVMAVDGTTFEHIIYGETQSLGTALWAMPLRSWDARFNLMGTRVLDNEIPVFRSLLESVYVPGGLLIPDVSFLVRGRDFHVNKVLCKRQTRYKAIADHIILGNDIDVCVTEVQELIIQRHKLVHEQFRATAMINRLSMIQAGLLHFAISLIPNKIEKALQQNISLEIGDEVNWITENMLGSLKEGTILPALEKLVTTILRKVDDIGFNNNHVYEVPVPVV